MNDRDLRESAGEVRTPAPEITVARAVQKLAARAVRRGALPLGGLLVAGVVEGMRSGFWGPASLLVAGAIVSGAVMLLYGVQAVRRVMGRAAGAWGPIFWIGSWIPYAYGMYALFWVGLRPLASPGIEGLQGGAVTGLVYAILGTLMIRAQWKLSEVHALAREMTGFAPGTGA